MSRRHILLIGIAAAIGFAALWHGPLGAGERLARQVEASARRTLDSYEIADDPGAVAARTRSPAG